MRFLLALCALIFSLEVCAAKPWMVPLVYAAERGEFTVGFDYCQGWKCAAPESITDWSALPAGWHHLTVVHAAAGVEFYRDGQRLTLQQAQTDDLYTGALVIGWGRLGYVREQMINGFKVVGMNLQGGYMSQTFLLRGVHREVLSQPAAQIKAACAADVLW